MNNGDNVKYIVDGKVGKCLGPIYHFQVWWMQVEWTNGSISLVHKDYLEVINESR